MVLFEGPRPSKSLSKTLKSVSPTLEITQIRSFSGLQTLLRETNPRGWDGQSIPEITFFPIKCQNRLRMSGKKWRLPILFLQPEPSISSILSITGYRCCADFVFHHGFCLLRNRNSSSAVISSPTGLGCQLGSRFGMHRQGILLVRHWSWRFGVPILLTTLKLFARLAWIPSLTGTFVAVIQVFSSSSSICDHTDLRPFSQFVSHSLHVFPLIPSPIYEVKTPIPILQPISPPNQHKSTREGGHFIAFPPQRTTKLVCNPTNRQFPCCLSHPKVSLLDFCFHTNYGKGSSNPKTPTTGSAFLTLYHINFSFLSI